MRYTSKILEIPPQYTIAQTEALLDQYLNLGWTFSQIYNVGQKVYAIIIKQVAV